MSSETLIDGVYLRFYTHAHVRHEGLLLSEWLVRRQRGRSGEP